MSIFQIPAKKNSPKSTEPNMNSNNESTANVDSNNKSTANVENGNIDKTKKRKTIVLDGPLSTIYTKALNIVYSNTPDDPTDSISQESQVTDYAIIAQDEIEKNKEENEKPDLYVYVTDSEKLESEGVNRVFDKLRLALDKNKKTIVAIETDKHFTNSQAILEYYLFKNNVQVFHSRNVALEKIKMAIAQL